MKKIFFLFLLLYANITHAQYRLIGPVYNCARFIPADKSDENVFYKGYKNYLFVVNEKNEDSNTRQYNILGIDLLTGKVAYSDSILHVPNAFFLEDFVSTENYILLTSIKSYIYHDYKSGQTIFYPPTLEYARDTFPFSKASILNDSLVLLYEISNFHPADGLMGVFLNIFNVNTRKITKRKFLDFPGIAIANVMRNWVVNSKGRIYVITPLSAHMYVYDYDLNYIETRELPVFADSTLKKNLAFEKDRDSIITTEWKRIRKIVDSLPHDSLSAYYWLLRSDIFGKDFISATLARLRNNYAFIEKTFMYDSATIGISVCRPDFIYRYRSLYLYDIALGKIIRSFPLWLSGRRDTLKTPEDFYTVALMSEHSKYPYFYKGYIYTVNQFPLSIFKPCTLKDFAKTIYQYQLKYGQSWSVLKYQLY